MDPIEKGAKEICNLLRSSDPFFVGRNGTIELEVIFFWMVRRLNSPRPVAYPHSMLDTISLNAGIFPRTAEAVDGWCTEYCKAIGEMNGLAAGWYKPLETIEAAILKTYASGSEFRCPLRSLEPYYVKPELQWTRALGGKRATVVSSFAESIQKQIEGERFPGIWRGPNEGLLNAPTWSFVRTGYAPALAMGRCEWPVGVDTWRHAVDYVVDAVKASNADIAIIGCGGLGVPIGAELKRRGISAIVLGGATQVLFGIKGARWAAHPVISGFWTDAWVHPSEGERPNRAGLIEGGCYW